MFPDLTASLCLIVIFTVMSSGDIPGRSSLFCREREKEWIWKERGSWEEMGGVEGGECVVGMFCMREQ